MRSNSAWDDRHVPHDNSTLRSLEANPGDAIKTSNVLLACCNQQTNQRERPPLDEGAMPHRRSALARSAMRGMEPET